MVYEYYKKYHSGTQMKEVLGKKKQKTCLLCKAYARCYTAQKTCKTML